MEKNLYRFQNLDQQSPDLSAWGDLHYLEQQNLIPAYMKPFSNGVSPKGSLLPYTFSGLQPSRVSEPYKNPNWSSCLPCYQQALAPLAGSMHKARLPTETVENIGGPKNTAFGTGHAQKRFLVFDQSGPQTTLIYSSEIGSLAPCFNSCNPKPPVTHNWLGEKLGINGDAVSPLGPHFGPFLNDEYYEGNQKDDAESEMHEDTEEINALLYSDDADDYSEDDEETSTGHSPSTMTAHRVHEWFDENGEEVASSCGSTKRQKLLNGGYDPALMDTATSSKCTARSELKDDGEFSSFSCRKRSRKEYIHDTVRALQGMIPDGKGKNALDIIDEAIHYLRSLKAKAKDLGLDSL